VIRRQHVWRIGKQAAGCVSNGSHAPLESPAYAELQTAVLAFLDDAAKRGPGAVAAAGTRSGDERRSRRA